MAMFTRWDPFSEMTSLRQAMNEMFERAWIAPSHVFGQAWGQFPLDLYETENDYVVSCVLPGVRPEDLTITTKGNVLTISGEAKPEQVEGATYHLRERGYGRFSRQIVLPEDVRADGVEATMADGILRLRLPKAEEAKPRRIQIHHAATPQLAEVRNGVKEEVAA